MDKEIKAKTCLRSQSYYVLEVRASTHSRAHTVIQWMLLPFILNCHLKQEKMEPLSSANIQVLGWDSGEDDSLYGPQDACWSYRGVTI